jgi:broad specificity phosphatase PhoE
VTAQTSENPVVRRPETGWSRARRLRGARALRTCLPAVGEKNARRTAQGGTEENIFRGED